MYEYGFNVDVRVFVLYSQGDAAESLPDLMPLGQDHLEAQSESQGDRHSDQEDPDNNLDPEGGKIYILIT